ncbi:hypothetical protein StrepF001_15205 [Streptomyces sp. F001]|uniref:hypothetical protein n=1 Tax=Streptomyces sp. F001 TaxID=1510026 RepID=UPI00101E5840|nr:hypothetical protein [Streptomyces sp. F001]RZB18417.1 hypothetical protein StrepF001_15205 [Streptomyces sp. F001]
MNVRLLALAGVVACAVALPLAVASAGPVGEPDPLTVRLSPRGDAKGFGTVGSRDGTAGSRPDTGAPHDDAAAVGEGAAASADRPAPRRSPFLLGLGLATAARCGPELASPDGIEAQTCVLTQGEQTWARTYYRNATGDALDAVLSLMGPGDRTVQMRCAVGAEDEPASCETPRERTQGDPGDYSAVAEYAARGGRGPLLLRSGSNFSAPTGS